MRKMTQRELDQWATKRPQRMFDAMRDLTRVLYKSRDWHRREQICAGYDMHPAIQHAIYEADPANWHLLVLEWPHASDEGKHKIAYTRDERSGEANRQVVTTVGKYMTRHFPSIPSDVIRDIAAKYAQGVAKFVYTTIEMVDVIENGPSSCMSKSRDRFPDDRHPYEAYAPEFGWHMAVYSEGGNYTGRALCNEKYFVRSYRADTGSSYSSTDDRLEAWLRSEGYTKTNNWSGYQLKKISVRGNNCGYLAPYLDGDAKYVTDGFYITDDDSDAQWEFDQTDGDADTISGETCADCDDRIRDGDGYWTGVHEDCYVCERCLNNHYTSVYGRNGNTYYLHDGNSIIYVGDEYYDADYLTDNDIVELENGDYVHSDDATYVDRLSEHHLSDDCVHCEHSDEYELARDCVELADGEWAHEDDAWCCDHSGKYYLNDDEDIRYETECGKTVHIDYADRYAPEQTTLPLE
ncbi:hypothetical protein UFOVP654_75 [uncultured Caudovirales phage]|uniref:Uncharacterized protein n=1 Tax=uncultured Caudovirales phage TaxID=2100421 RepID=A0A6J5N7T0_9CAUD|nr:hypothetical protein UFOVP654_75 [uncultured Caudovirales phage]